MLPFKVLKPDYDAGNGMRRNAMYRGEVLAPGSAEGVATGLDGGGEILVARRVTPLDSLKVVDARGIIVEWGGTLSHIAIYARELGIPCVRLPDATRLIPAGSRVRIRGDGTVEVLF